MAAVVGILIALLALTWEIVGIISKKPRVETYSQIFWYIREYVEEHTGKAGLAVLGAGLAGFLTWLFIHFMFPGSV